MTFLREIPQKAAVRLGQKFIVKQRLEPWEFLGYETRNKYAISTDSGVLVAFAAEQQKGFWGFLFRQILGHWRSFEIHIFDSERNIQIRAVHPFRWYFEKIEIFKASGEYLGAVQKRFSLFRRRFDVQDSRGGVTMTVHPPFFSIWTFPFMRNGEEIALIQKRWSGIMQEMLTDADIFHLEFKSSALTEDDKAIILASSIYIDLQYFESKASKNRSRRR